MNWINSSLLLQQFSSPEMFGRVFAVDGALALLTEPSSALLSGCLQDHWVENPRDIALGVSTLGSLLVGLWTMHHLL